MKIHWNWFFIVTLPHTVLFSSFLFLSELFLLVCFISFFFVFFLTCDVLHSVLYTYTQNAEQQILNFFGFLIHIFFKLSNQISRLVFITAFSLSCFTFGIICICSPHTSFFTHMNRQLFQKKPYKERSSSKIIFSDF